MSDVGGFGGVHEPGTHSGARRSDSGAFLVDSRGTVLGFDRRMEDLTGWSAVDLVGRRYGLGRLVAGWDDDPSLLAGDAEATGFAEPAELRLVCKDGRTLDVEAALARSGADGNRLTVHVLRVVARSPIPEAHPESGLRDELTGLATARAFGDRLDKELAACRAEARPLGLILADVDHLRRVNDTMGREAGDRVLRKLAGILRATIRDEDLVARLEDDDFAILVPGMGRGSARQMAARLRSTVERFNFAGPDAEPGLYVTLSLGASSFPADADAAQDLADRAKDALREARALGRNRVWCYMRRPRVPLRTPVYLDGDEPLLLGYSSDLSPSGVFVATPAPIEIGMRCALAFPLPDSDGHIHVIGRVVRTVPLTDTTRPMESRSPGMGIEFERFGPEDRRAIESFLHANQAATRRPEGGLQSV